MAVASGHFSGCCRQNTTWFRYCSSLTKRYLSTKERVGEVGGSVLEHWLAMPEVQVPIIISDPGDLTSFSGLHGPRHANGV